MRIFLNTRCAYGAGLSRWKRIEPELRARFSDFQVEQILSAETFASQFRRSCEKGERFFVAAGGDGTVNLLLNAIMAIGGEREEIRMGAIGLGSSNDFHKPFSARVIARGIPLRLDTEKAPFHDAIRIECQDSRKDRHVRYSLINASIGVTAEANAIYNSRRKTIAALHRLSCEAAIAASALEAVFTYRDIPCVISNGNREGQVQRVTNLGIMKNPHFAGLLCYDTSVDPGDGKLRVNLCSGLSLPERLAMLISLYRHRFQGRPKTMSWMATELAIDADREFALEMDGEVVRARQARITIVSRAVRCCQ